ncbi:MAG: hypothetical protein CSB21_01660 [Deltaproteobacteria bacterium]|nr:MAG: hypothetical protein CSB21_01660 [Deltaproteobacteria bacterium]
MMMISARNKFVLILVVNLVLFLCSSSFVLAKKKVPWHLRHFPNAPRITAKQALIIKKSNPKVVLIDVPWSKKGFEKGHICGAIPTSVEAGPLDRLISKIPRDYIILSY